MRPRGRIHGLASDKLLSQSKDEIRAACQLLLGPNQIQNQAIGGNGDVAQFIVVLSR